MWWGRAPKDMVSTPNEPDHHVTRETIMAFSQRLFLDGSMSGEWKYLFLAATRQVMPYIETIL